jgi:phage-related protein
VRAVAMLTVFGPSSALDCPSPSIFFDTQGAPDGRELQALASRILEIGGRPAAGARMVNELPRDDKRSIGRDIAKMQFGWPVGLPLCRPLSAGLWEVRSSLPSKREARVLFGFHEGMLVALHAFIKKAQKTPQEELALARERLKELRSWRGRTRT